MKAGAPSLCLCLLCNSEFAARVEAVNCVEEMMSITDFKLQPSENIRPGKEPEQVCLRLRTHGAL